MSQILVSNARNLVHEWAATRHDLDGVSFDGETLGTRFTVKVYSRQPDGMTVTVERTFTDAEFLDGYMNRLELVGVLERMARICLNKGDRR